MVIVNELVIMNDFGVLVPLNPKCTRGGFLSQDTVKMGRFSLNCGLWYEILSTVFCSSDTMQRVACLISCMHSASFLPFPCTGMFSCI